MNLDTIKSKKDTHVSSQTEDKYDLSSAADPLGRRRIMDDGIQLLRKHKYGELWQQCCGYIDLSLKEIMNIQKDLLLKQLPLLNNSELGKVIMRGAIGQNLR